MPGIIRGESDASKEGNCSVIKTYAHSRRRCVGVGEPRLQDTWPDRAKTPAVARVSTVVSRVELRGFEPLTP